MLLDPKWTDKVRSTPVSERAIDPCGQVLLDAAARIERLGWYRDGWGHVEKGICPKEAIARATHDPLLRYAAEKRLEHYVGRRPDIWNYTPGLTKDIVVATLRLCATASINETIPAR